MKGPAYVDRDPCPRCGIRRDVGCEHYAAVAREDGRKTRDYAGQGHNFRGHKGAQSR